MPIKILSTQACSGRGFNTAGIYTNPLLSPRIVLSFNATSTWTVPTGVAFVDYLVVAGGGGGGGSSIGGSHRPNP